MTTWNRMGRGSGRSSTRSRSRGRSRGTRRKLTWKSAYFSPGTVALNTITEFNLATEAELASLSLGRGTIAVIYGRVLITIPRDEAQDDVASGAWGICLKEADVAASTTGFSPLSDADSTMWITNRAFSLQKEYALNEPGNGQEGIDTQIDVFVIRNPRKVQADQELVAMFHNGASSTAAIRVNAWFRIGIILP